MASKNNKQENKQTQIITTVQTIEEFHRFIKTTVLPLIRPKTILILSGPMGAGKTEAVKTITQLLGMTDVASPSFAIHHQYKNPSQQCIEHVDLYRLKDEDDLESTGFWDLFSQTNSTVIIEWGDLLNKDLLPISWKLVEMKIDVLSPSQRKISFKH